MNLSEYQQLSARTLNPESCFPTDDNYVLGLFGEGGEFTDILKKDKYHGHGLDLMSKKKTGKTIRQELAEEIGDAFWYVSAIGNSIDVDLEEIYRLCVPFDKHNANEVCRFYFYHCVQIDHYRQHLIERKHLPLERRVDEACMIYHLAHTIGCLISLLNVIQYPIEHCLIENVDKLKKRYPEKYSKEASLNRKD